MWFFAVIEQKDKVFQSPKQQLAKHGWYVKYSVNIRILNEEVLQPEPGARLLWMVIKHFYNHFEIYIWKPDFVQL